MSERVALKRALILSGLTQRDVARRFGMSQSALSYELRDAPPTDGAYPYEAEVRALRKKLLDRVQVVQSAELDRMLHVLGIRP